MENTPLDDILKDEKPAEATEVTATEATEATPTEVVEEKPSSRRKRHLAKEYEAQGRDPDTGQFTPKEEEAKTEVKAEVKEVNSEPKKAEAQEFTDKEKAFLRGLEEERRKRQDLERQLNELRKPQDAGEKKTFWDDPEGHFKNFEQRLAQRETALSLRVSENIARSKYTDFDGAIEVFAEILKTPAGPGVHAQFLAAQDPAEFAYRLGKQTRELREVGSVEAMREKIAKEERAKLEAEFKKKQSDLAKQREELTPTLSDVKGASKQHEPVFRGPTPFKDILGLK